MVQIRTCGEAETAFQAVAFQRTPPSALSLLAGPNREMKKALEAHWSRGITSAELLEAASAVEAAAWRAQAEAGIDLIGLDGTLYDQVLDATFQLGLIPSRFKVGGGC